MDRCSEQHTALRVQLYDALERAVARGERLVLGARPSHVAAAASAIAEVQRHVLGSNRGERKAARLLAEPLEPTARTASTATDDRFERAVGPGEDLVGGERERRGAGPSRGEVRAERAVAAHAAQDTGLHVRVCGTARLVYGRASPGKIDVRTGRITGA